MNIRDLIPFNWSRERDVPVRREPPAERWPRGPLGTGFDRYFEDFFGSLPSTFGASALTPRLNVHETDDSYIVEAEIPGMDEKDLDVSIDRNALVLRGEKKHEHREEKDGHVHRVECSYGRFERRLPLPDYVSSRDAKATYRHGVVTVTMAKDPAKSNSKRIPVKTG